MDTIDQMEVGDCIVEAKRNGLERYIAQRWPELCVRCVREVADDMDTHRYASWDDYLASDGAWVLGAKLPCGCCAHEDNESASLYWDRKGEVRCAQCDEFLEWGVS